ncbi:MAG TPA: tetratricopeptide repeat protein, partial [Thermoanaerobaculia bacterium]|nr:tetratricopeptide repeat protein [Thermoanaerobaculia bacterium]
MRRALALALLLLAAPLAAQVPGVPAPEAIPQITPEEQKRLDDFVSAASHGMKFFERGDMPSAYEQFVAADAIYPNHPTVVYDMAVLLVRLGRLAEAQEKVDLYLS